MQNIVNDSLKINETVIKKRQMLASVLLDKVNDDVKLQNLCYKILDLNQQKQDLVEPSTLNDEQVHAAFDQLEKMSELMKTIYKPIYDYRKLTETIGDVMRSETLKDNQKIEKITRLLL